MSVPLLSFQLYWSHVVKKKKKNAVLNNKPRQNDDPWCQDVVKPLQDLM